MEILLKEKPRAPIDYTEDDVEILARTIYGEARDQGEDGMSAVGNVVLNRLNKKSWYGDTIEEIIKLPEQFSVFNAETVPESYPMDDNYKATISVTTDDPYFVQSMEIARGLLDGRIKDNTNGATHYFNPNKANPDWENDPQMTQLIKIGDHTFYLENLN